MKFGLAFGAALSVALSNDRIAEPAAPAPLVIRVTSSVPPVSTVTRAKPLLPPVSTRPPAPATAARPLLDTVR